jgi:hypothetical protein
MYRRIAIDHWSCRQVAQELNDLGIPTLYAREDRGVRGERTTGRWGEGRIRNMVVNPTYKGVLTFGKRTKKQLREVITASCEPLVTEELWQAAQAVLASHRVAAKNTERTYILRGVMTCIHCGQRLIGSTNRDTTYYRCGGKRQGRGDLGGRCFGRDVKGEAIEARVWGDIERWLRDPGDLLDELDGRAERDAADARRTEERGRLERAIAELDAQRQRLIRLAVDGVLTDAEVRSERERIASERALLEARLHALAPEAAEVPSLDPDLLDQLRARLDAGLTDQERQEIVSLLVQRIEVTTTVAADGLKGTSASITYRCPIAAVHTRRDRDSWPR